MNKQMSQKGIEMLKNFEGCRLEAYDDLQPNIKITSIKQVKGTLTIGYGHTGSDVKPNMKITQVQADAYLKEDLHKFENGVTNLLKVDVTQGQFDALVDFSFNLGLGSLQSSTLLKDVNAKKFTDASKQFLEWNHAGGEVVAGLTRRRQAESNMFLNIK